MSRNTLLVKFGGKVHIINGEWLRLYKVSSSSNLLVYFDNKFLENQISKTFSLSYAYKEQAKLNVLLINNNSVKIPLSRTSYLINDLQQQLRNENAKKAIGVMTKTTLHLHFTLFGIFLCRHCKTRT